MLPALETLHNLGLFTRPEISKIFETRSSFETKLVRRVGKKDDFLQYILYERRLDALLRTRWKRLNASNMKEKRATEEKQAVNSVRGRIFALFERAVKKFKSDLGMWFEYIKYCREVNASSRAGKVCARAMQMHPNTPAIYIFAVSGDGAKEDSDWSPYDQPSLSRTLLLRGLRLNKDSVELWVAYVLWEYGWLEVVRKRWEVLGIGASESAESSEASKGLGDVLDGAIVRTVIDQAVKGESTSPTTQILLNDFS
jgi:U3 small nucleolar RNA-associated protein 6